MYAHLEYMKEIQQKESYCLKFAEIYNLDYLNYLFWITLQISLPLNRYILQLHLQVSININLYPFTHLLFNLYLLMFTFFTLLSSSFFLLKCWFFSYSFIHFVNMCCFMWGRTSCLQITKGDLKKYLKKSKSAWE